MKRLVTFARWLFGYDGIPYMSRPSFRYEMISGIYLGVAFGILMPSFCQLFARKTLEAPRWIIAGFPAQIALGNLLGAFLGPYLKRRRRVPYVVGGRVLIAVVMLAIAALPPQEDSAYPYFALMVLPALLAAVILNVLSSIWHSNYPAGLRGQIFSRRYIVTMGIAAVSVKLAGYALDAWPWAHRLVYAVAAGFMILSALAYMKVRVRGERAMLRSERDGRFHLLEGIHLLREDKRYGRFMAWQFISGGSLLLTLPAIVLMLTEHLGVDYARGTTALASLPIVMSLVMAPFFGRLFDSIRITRFRAMGAAMWASSRVVLFVGLFTRSWTCVLLASAIQGAAMATGGVAWNIAHTHFARPEKSQVYMGIHMSLQGLRGLTLPFLGVWLYSLPQVGLHLLWIAAAVQFAAALGFALSPAPPKQAAGDPPQPDRPDS